MQKCMYKGKSRRLASYKEIATESFGAIGGNDVSYIKSKRVQYFVYTNC